MLQCAADHLATFEALCRQMLEDVQERLVYRTYIYMRQEILHYHPAAGDLAYPEKLEMMEVCLLLVGDCQLLLTVLSLLLQY